MARLSNNVRRACMRIELILSDCEKLKYASIDQINYPNVGVAGFALTMTEPIAQLMFNFPEAKDPCKPNLRSPSAMDAVFLFWKNYFDNPAYFTYRHFIWKYYRHKITHLYSGVKVVEIDDLPETENRFLTGVGWETGNHLKMVWHNEQNLPYFDFDSFQYLSDLDEAIRKFLRQVPSDPGIQKTLEEAWRKYGDTKIGFRISHTDLKDHALKSEIDLLIKETKQIYMANKHPE